MGLPTHTNQHFLVLISSPGQFSYETLFFFPETHALTLILLSGASPDSYIRIKNALVVVANYLFYGWWDWRFLSLIIFSTLVDFAMGRKLRTEENQRRRKVLLWTSGWHAINFMSLIIDPEKLPQNIL